MLNHLKCWGCVSVCFAKIVIEIGSASGPLQSHRPLIFGNLIFGPYVTYLAVSLVGNAAKCKGCKFSE